MKTIVLATAFATLATSAFAGPAVVGYSEYAVEARTFEVQVGVQLPINDQFMFTPSLVGFGTSKNFAFSYANFNVTYNLNDNIDLYVDLDTDKNFNYAETTLGLAFSF